MNILNTVGKIYPVIARSALSELGTVDYKDGLTQDDLKSIVADYDIAVIALGLNFHKDILDSAKKLKYIVTATTGLDHIDVEYAKQKGIEVLSLRGETAFLDTITGTAELAFGLMIDLFRLTPWAFDDVKQYHWDRNSFLGHNAYEKTLGIVGMGRLGKWMARYGKAFGMNVLYHDPHIKLSTSDANSLGRGVSFDELLAESDAVSIHVHLLPETKHMFSADVFKKMKPTAYLINTSRGEIVDEGALLTALKTQKIGGYGADVLAGELNFHKGFENYPLVEYAKTNRNVIIVPHVGGFTSESRERTDVFMAEKLKRKLKM